MGILVKKAEGSMRRGRKQTLWPQTVRAAGMKEGLRNKVRIQRGSSKGGKNYVGINISLQKRAQDQEENLLSLKSMCAIQQTREG